MPTAVQPAVRPITLRGVAVHNLKQVDLDLPRGKLIVFCGLSGSGKSSLAFETLYAEGQRRYVETLSAYARGFLDVFQKPAAERIEGIPASIAIGQHKSARSNRSTVGTTTEIHDHLRLLFARIGEIHCPTCGTKAVHETPESIAARLSGLPDGARGMIAFSLPAVDSPRDAEATLSALRAQGFLRVIVGGRTHNLDGDLKQLASELASNDKPVENSERTPVDPQRLADRPLVVVDRITIGRVDGKRLRDSLESAFNQSHADCLVLVQAEDAHVDGTKPQTANQADDRAQQPPLTTIDDRQWRVWRFAAEGRCSGCDAALPRPEPRLFSFNQSLGACPACEGFGETLEVDMAKVVPDRNKSVRDGAIDPWNKPAYRHELDELLALADDYDIPVDIPFSKLDERSLALITHGVPERDFGGLDGFFAWLDRRRYKPHIRSFQNRFRSDRPCADCGGTRFRREVLSVTLGGKSIGDVCGLTVRQAMRFFQEIKLPDWQRKIARVSLSQTIARLSYLADVGLDYLTLDRPMRTLSGGEAQRTMLTSALGSSLVNVLYVFDEPTIGLHPLDTQRLISVIARLRDRGNTVVVVEHEEEFIRAADHVVEIGPEAGARGGHVTFDGTVQELEAADGVLTGDYLSRRRDVRPSNNRRPANRGWIEIEAARKHNLKRIDARFPLGCLCVVTGVSGSGKSSLVVETLYPAIRARLSHHPEAIADCDGIRGVGQINDCVLIDQSAMARSPRSNPATYVKTFDAIRTIFAETVDARTRGYAAGQFSFNTAGGRCETCQGAGYQQVDMQFLGDVFMRCESCGGKRFRPDVLEVRYRQRNIAEVLEMTVRQAFSFFRGYRKLQARLKKLMDVGLDYVPLGQPANTLSGGEAARLKLAAYLAGAARNRTLFILDEPTTGLHFADVVRLVDCLESLLADGHSLIAIEHNLQFMQFADHIIDLGPGAANEGGEILAAGTPEEIAACANSQTGKSLANVLQRE